MSDPREAIRQAWKKSHQSPFPCFLPDCQIDAIDSHSQSKARSLRQISESGHLIELHKNPLTCEQSFKRIGINEASTFKGFCANHDGELFSGVDALDDSLFRRDNLAKLALRTLASEVRAKERSILYLETVGSTVQIVDKQMLENYILSCKAYLVVTAPYYSKMFTDVLSGKNDQLLETFAYEYEECFPVATSSVLNCDMIDESNVGLPLDQRSDSFFMNVISKGEGGLAIFTFLPDHRESVKKITTSYDNLASMIFNHCAEVLIKPSFYEGLSKDRKQLILEAAKPWSSWKRVDFDDNWAPRFAEMKCSAI